MVMAVATLAATGRGLVRGSRTLRRRLIVMYGLLVVAALAGLLIERSRVFVFRWDWDYFWLAVFALVAVLQICWLRSLRERKLV